MPEPEFEVYLSLLSKFLHLTTSQREEVTTELRDHLEERLRELEAEGHPRSQAIKLTLDEFGEAATLAHDITRPHLTLHRRQLMRYSLGSVAVITVTFVLAAFYWPAQRPERAVTLVAQLPPVRDVGDEAGRLAAASPDNSASDLRREVERKLLRRDLAVAFQDVPLYDALEFLSDQLDLAMVFDLRHLEEYSIAQDTPITLTLPKQSVTGRTLLELVLRQASADALSYVIRDGIVLITSPEEGYEVQVYDCRDLLANVKVESPAVTYGDEFGGLGGFGGGSSSEGISTGAPAGAAGSASAGGMGSGSSFGTSGATSAAARALISVIMSASGEAWMDDLGSGGTISEFDGLIVVRHNQRVHRGIEELLTKLRERKTTGFGSSSQRK